LGQQQRIKAAKETAKKRRELLAKLLRLCKHFPFGKGQQICIIFEALTDPSAWQRFPKLLVDSLVGLFIGRRSERDDHLCLTVLLPHDDDHILEVPHAFKKNVFSSSSLCSFASILHQIEPKLESSMMMMTTIMMVVSRLP